MELSYLAGLGNHFSTEAAPNAVPTEQNSPQKHPLGLYTEQLSGTAFTLPRHSNQSTWLYKLRPTVSGQRPYCPLALPKFSNSFSTFLVKPDQLRWKKPDFPSESSQVTFIDGITTMAGVGDPALRTGLALYMYTCNSSMENSAFYSADGD